MYKLKLNQNYLVNGLEFNYTVENPNVDSNQNRSFPFEIHYTTKGIDNKINTFKSSTKYYSNDLHLTNEGYKSIVYFDRELETDTLFLTTPKKIILNGNEHSIVQIENFVALVNNSESFTNTRNANNSNKSNNREDFQSTTEYSPDELCPSLSGIENQMKLADNICERIEYNDKIKNERLKLKEINNIY